MIAAVPRRGDAAAGWWGAPAQRCRSRRTCRAAITSPVAPELPGPPRSIAASHRRSACCVVRSLPATCLAQPSSIHAGFLAGKSAERSGSSCPMASDTSRPGRELAISSLHLAALLLAVHPQVIGRLQTGQTWRIVWSLTALAGGPITPARHLAADRWACLPRTRQIPPPSVSHGAQPAALVTTGPAGSPSPAP